MTIQTVKGCLLDALADEKVSVIGHCANMQNTFGAGIAADIKRRFPAAYNADFVWFNSPKKGPFSLAQVEPNKFIFNLYGQDKYGKRTRHLNYGLFAQALLHMSSVCMPGERIGFPYRMGCGNAGGDWAIVYEMIEVFFAHCDVTIYKLEKPI